MMPSPNRTTPTAPSHLQAEILAADPTLELCQARHIAAHLQEAGWNHSSDLAGSGGIPADRIRETTRFLLRLRLRASTQDSASAQAASLATCFSSEGAQILQFCADVDEADLEILCTVEQALRVASVAPDPLHHVAVWLRSAGYTGDLIGRLRSLAGRSEPQIAPLPALHYIPDALRMN